MLLAVAGKKYSGQPSQDAAVVTTYFPGLFILKLLRYLVGFLAAEFLIFIATLLGVHYLCRGQADNRQRERRVISCDVK